MEGVVKLFAPLGRAMAKLESGYSRQQLDLIRDYLDRAGDILYQETLRLKKGTKH